ncbi:MAG: aminopeptidase [Patescibacteria group bacterium]
MSENLEAKYGHLAEQYGEREFSPETNQEHERLRQVARNIIDCYDWQPGQEEFLIVTDTKVMAENPMMLKALEFELTAQGKVSEAGKERTAARLFKTMVTEASPKSATPLNETIGEAMRDRPVLIITSMSRSHSKETGTAIRGDTHAQRESIDQVVSSDKMRSLSERGMSEFPAEKLDRWGGRIPDDQWLKMKQLAKARGSRVISITKGHNPYDILTKGAVLENVENLRERAKNVSELMKDVKRVHITTPLGTDLWVPVRPDLTEIEDGNVNKPGRVANYPIGEWSCSPDWEGCEGRLVVDGPTGGNVNQDILDKGKPLVLRIERGQIVASDGGDEAHKKWKDYLDSGNNMKNDAYRVAELGIGTNARALEEKPRKHWGSSEGEKKYGTVHVAVGSNGSFGRTPEDPNFNGAQVHCDMVIGLNRGGEPTVECERKDGSTFKLIDNGQPIGY